MLDYHSINMDRFLLVFLLVNIPKHRIYEKNVPLKHLEKRLVASSV